MFHHLLILLLSLVALSVGTPIGLDMGARATAVCQRPAGVYDVCDTMHSFLRCRGVRPMTAFDCAQEPDHYCLILNDRGSCTGRSPPPMNSTLFLH